MSKISELTDGGSLLPTDFLIAVRSGGNVKVQADDITVDQIRLGDNEKIELGNSQDLQIYHDGTDSIIQDIGTGNLDIKTNGAYILLRNTDGNNLAYFETGGGSHLYWNGASGLGRKLQTTATGIDVTGSVTADGATVSGQTIISADALVATPSTYYDELVVQNSASGTGAGMTILVNATNGFGGIKFGDSGNSNQFGIGFDASANLGFLDVLGGQALTIDSSRNVGIGVVPESHYTGYVGIDFGNSGGLFSNTSGTNLTGLSNNAYLNSDASAWIYKETDEASYYNQTAGTHRFSVAPSGTAGTSITWSEAMRIDASGRVGIGVVPEAWTVFDGVLQIGSGGAVASTAAITRLSNNIYYDGAYKRIATGPVASYIQNSGIHIWTSDVSGTGDVGFTETERMRITSAGYVEMASASQVRLTLGSQGTAGTNDSNWIRGNTTSLGYNSASGDHAWEVGGSPRMTLKAGGDLLVGKTTTALATAGLTLGGAGFASLTRNGAEPLNVNRLSSDGDLAVFYKDSVVVGSIQAVGGDLNIGTGDTGLLFVDSLDAILPSITTNPAAATRDAAIDLGRSATRFKDLYLSGNISTGIGAADAGNYQIRVSAGTTGLSRFIAADTSDAGYIDYEHSSDSWIHRTASEERVRINADGATIYNGKELRVKRPNGSGDIRLFNTASYATLESTVDPIYIKSANAIRFDTSGNNQRMLLDASGNLLVGATGFANPASGFTVAAGGETKIQINHVSGTGSGVAYATFRYNLSAVGSITQHGTSATLYNTTSDERLKENIADADDAGSKIDAIQVRKYDWKADGSHQDYGMVAQELLEVAPEAVSAPEDPEEMMGVDYSKLVPMMLKEIQSLRARIAALES